MFLKFSLSATLLALLLGCLPVSAQSSADKKAAERAAKMKAEVVKLGTGRDARINVKLNDGSKLSGYISEIKNDTFVLVSDQSGAATEIQYSDATQFYRHGSGLSRTQQTLIAVGAVVGGLVIFCAIRGCQQ